MTEMSGTESLFCRSRPWQAFARRVVLPWALQGVSLDGEALELGSGSGAMAARLLEAFPRLRVVATDFDETMVDRARERLQPYGARAEARQADGTALLFSDITFDVILSFLMLHHIGSCEKALEEATRVLRPGGLLLGYDLANTLPFRLIHQAEGAGYRMVKFEELRSQAAGLPLDHVALRRGLGGLVIRFSAMKRVMTLS